VAYGYGLFTGGLGAHYGAERLGCTVVPMSGGQTEKQVQLIIGQPNLAPHYILEVRRDGALDHLEVIVELDAQVANVASIRDEAARDLQRRIKSYVGVTASVSACNPGLIERSVGKAKRVVDKRMANWRAVAG
jgi:phenylacetate-coenzyme A ligase PaaK-like adenylate-forming protein